MNDMITEKPALADFVERAAADIVRDCTHCGACVEICPVAPFAGVADSDHGATVAGVLEEFGIPCSKGRLRLPSLLGDVGWLADRAVQGLGLYNQEIHVLGEMNKTIACSIDKAKGELGALFGEGDGTEDDGPVGEADKLFK